MKYQITLELECTEEELIGVKEQLATIKDITVTNIERTDNESEHINAK